MSKSISPMLFLMPEAKPFRASPRSHRSDEFAVGYSLAVCSPALPASASPAGIHLQTAGSYLSTVSFGKISKLDSKVRTRQNINVRGGPNQSIEVGQTGVSNSQPVALCAAVATIDMTAPY
jgi:spore coat protein U-like protein